MSSTLKSIDGVIKANADYKSQTVTVVFDDKKLKKADIVKKIEDIGFEVSK